MPRALLVIAVLAGGCTVENPFHGPIDLSRAPDAGFDFALPEIDFSVELPDFSVDTEDLAGRDLAGRDLAMPDLAMADLSMPDLSMQDLSTPDLALVTTTFHAIDTGQILDATQVTVSGAILTGIARFTDITNMTMRCIYEAFAEDASAAPSGMRLVASGPVCTSGPGGCTCPFPPSSGTPLDSALTLGERFTVTGFVDVFVPPSGPTIHSIQLTSLLSTGTGTVTPVDFTSGAAFADNGSGYLSHESMLVRIIPAAPFTISTVSPRGSFTGAGAEFEGLYRFVYGAAGTFPASGSTWTSITGIAQPGFGGGIAPRTQSDFVP